MKTYAKILAVAAFVVLAGCAQVSAFLGSPVGADVILASVNIGVATAESKGITAAQINGIAKAALAADAGTSTTLAVVAGVVNANIAKAGLPAGDVAAADILVAAVSAAIQAKVGASTSLAAAQADAATVLKDVIAASGG